MRVGLNLLFLVPGETGGRETYARELIPKMVELSDGVEFIAFTNSRAAAELRRELGEALSVIRVPIDVSSRAAWAAGELLSVPAAAARQRVDILHSLANFGPAVGPFTSVLTVHDAHRHGTAAPESVSSARQTVIDVMMRVAAHKAGRIITVSRASRDEICEQVGVSPSKVDVTPLGFGRARKRGKRSLEETRDEFRLAGRRVGLTVASNLPHKNLVSGVRALATLPADRRPVLVLAGLGTDARELQEAATAACVSDDVRLIGYCDDETLEDLFGVADLILLPTLYEGFGLPVLEAMARGIPVACSDIPVLREVAGENALFFDPRSPEDLAAAIDRLLGDGQLHETLAANGVAHARSFTWTRTAELTLRSYERAAGRT